MKSLRGLVLIAALAGTGACGEPQRDVTVPEDLDLAGVYARMTEAMTREGEVLHVRQTWESSGEIAWPVPRIESELWIDPAAGIARRELQAPGAGIDAEVEIITARASYRLVEGETGQMRRPLTCRESDSPLVSALSGCLSYLEESQSHVDSKASYRGKSMVAVVTEGTWESHDETLEFVSLLYIDPASWLPVALERDGTLHADEDYEADLLVRYESEFVDADSLPDGFFDPAANGFVEPDPAKPLDQDPGIPVYWLDRTFSPGGGLPPIALERAVVHTADPRLPPSYRVDLTYRDASEDFGAAMVSLQEFAPADWEALNPRSEGHWWNWPGTRRENVPLDAGYAVIFAQYDEGYSGDRFLAHVYLEGTVLLVGDFDEPSPYASREAMLAVIHGLVRRP